MCEKMELVASVIGKLQHCKQLKPAFVNSCLLAIRPVFIVTVTFTELYAS